MPRRSARPTASLLLLLTLLVAGAAAAPGSKAEEELRAAIKGVSQGTAKKVAVVRLRRALDSARQQGEAIPQALLEEAESALQGLTEADRRLAAARASLQAAAEEAEAAEQAGAAAAAPALEAALREAEAAGLTKGPEVVRAQKALAKAQEASKRAARAEAKRRRLCQEVEQLSKAEAASVNITALRAAITAVKGHLTSEECPVLANAEASLAAAEWLALPPAARLDRASAAHGREACQPPRPPRPSVCRRLSSAEWLARSRAVGETNCNHPTLRPGGQAAPLKNALPPETSKNFCKYPPPFDLREAEDGQGYRTMAFDFPPRLFNHTKLQEDGFAELAVINLDMDTFRSSIAPCQNQEVWLLEFYVHWCPHCMAMMPKLYKLAVALRAAGSPLRIGAVNCAAQRELCGAFQVIGHPLMAFFYPGAMGPGGQVQLFEYGGRDVRVNAALNYLKANRNPAWDAGAPAGHEPPRHLFPAEAVTELIRLLPEEYRPADAVLRWLGNSSRTSARVCPDVRGWYEPAGHLADAVADAGVGALPNASDSNTMEAGGAAVPSDAAVAATSNHSKRATRRFPGDGWPAFEHVAEPAHRVRDAVEAVVYTLEEWVVPNAAGDSPNAFAYLELSDLQRWVSLLAENLPTKDEGGVDLRPALGVLAGQLADRMRQIEGADGRGALCHSEWQALVRPVRRVLDGWTELPSLPSLCRTETCKMWTLLHLLSVAPFARGSASSKVNLPATDTGLPVPAGQPSHTTLDTMTAFLRRYFTCQTCRKHFLEQVEAGAHGLAAARAGGPRELALWWWGLHNSVSQRVGREGKCKADRRWPAADLCGSCWPEVSRGTAGSTFAEEADEDAVARQLASRYWPSKPPVQSKALADGLPAQLPA